MSTLMYEDLKTALTGGAAAFRLTAKLEAVSPKVFPRPTKAASTRQRIGSSAGKSCRACCLTRVASQANRMELALQEAWSGGDIDLPVVSVDFEKVENPGVPKITSLQAPHRIADAILRDSTLGDGKKPPKFRDSEIGKELDQLSAGYATPLLKYAPHCLVFGMWDSTGPRGGLGVNSPGRSLARSSA